MNIFMLRIEHYGLYTDTQMIKIIVEITKTLYKIINLFFMDIYR